MRIRKQHLSRAYILGGLVIRETTPNVGCFIAVITILFHSVLSLRSACYASVDVKALSTRYNICIVVVFKYYLCDCKKLAKRSMPSSIASMAIQHAVCTCPMNSFVAQINCRLKPSSFANSFKMCIRFYSASVVAFLLLSDQVKV